MTIAVVRVQVPLRVLFWFNLFKLTLTPCVSVHGVFCFLFFDEFEYIHRVSLIHTVIIIVLKI